MKVYESDALNFKGMDLSDTLYVYNGMDSALTIEIFNEIYPSLDNNTAGTYQFEMDFQAPALAMMERGILVNNRKRTELILYYGGDKEKYLLLLDKLALAIGFEGKSALSGTRKGEFRPGLNPQSPKQLKEFFYDYLGLPIQWSYGGGKRKPSTNRESLEALLRFPIARPFVRVILAIRDVAKKLSVLQSPLDPDGRMRFSIHVGATVTGRLSSSENNFGGGTNLQNITKVLREIFIASKGYKFCNVDLSQADSHGVAYLSGDEAYINAIKSGDLHTYVTKMVWPDLPWTGDLKQDKAIAEQKFYRHFSYRDTSKRLGHATNFLATAYTLHVRLKIPLDICEEFLRTYLKRFKGIKDWQRWTRKEIMTNECLITPYGRKRIFMDDPTRDATIREAIGHVPQSITSDTINEGILLIFNELDEWGPSRGPLRLLLQVHDSVLFEFPDTPSGRKAAKKAEQLLILTKAVEDINGVVRNMTIPVESHEGYDWRNLEDFNSAEAKRQKRPQTA